MDEENTDCADEKRREASARIASLRVSNMEVRSWEAIITPKTRRMTSAATVIARAMRADRECRMRLARCEEARRDHGLDDATARARSLRASLRPCAGTIPNPADCHDQLGTLRVAFNLRTKALHVNIDEPGVSCMSVAPHLFEEFLAREHLPR